MTLHDIINEALSAFNFNKQSTTYLKVNRTKAQRRKLLSIFILIAIMIQVVLAFSISLLDYLRYNQMNIFIFQLLGFAISIESIAFIIWTWLHSRFSPNEKLRLRTLLKDFAEENDILRKHKSDIDTTQSIRWQYYIESNLIYITLYQGGHVTPSRTKEIPQALLAFFVKETRHKWFLEQYHLGDGFVKMVYSHKPDKALTVKGYEDFRQSSDLRIRLTERLDWTSKQPMGLIVGPTSSGKTTLIKYLILAFLINNRKNRVYTIDGKGAYLSQSMGIIGEVAISGNDAYQMISRLEEMMNERYDELNHDTSKDEDVTYHEKFKSGQTLLIIDEYLALATTMQAEDKLRKPADRLFPQFYAKLMNLIVKGRQASIYVIISGQMIPTSILPSEARDSLGLRIVLGRISQAQATEIFNSGLSELPSADSSRYEGLIFLDGLGLEHPIVFKTPFYDDRQLPFKGALRVLNSERCSHRSEI
ncbi:cell division protein FtsK [Streptococcus dysgalactiae]|uniref:FtsK/SpoIIIE domain-containing protein n=1 Tax=Streptococcus dysgalactiae TaxID=1334 RepID=UPI001C9DF6F2|nr:FtsK/SpoIIIE domain-containing protein [Streptococcus dysgalactiae]QZT27489.1 cell division protein FtsK [Streptococcus dysgalactiae]